MPHQFELPSKQTSHASVPVASTTLVTGEILPPPTPLHSGEAPESAATVTSEVPQKQTSTPNVEERWRSLLAEWKQAPGSPLMRPASVLCSSMLILSTPVYLLALHAAPDPALCTFLYLCWLGVWGMLLLGAVTQPPQRLNSKETVLFNQLSETEDLHAVGPLLEAWQETTNWEARAQLAAVLVRLLPHLRREDSARLTTSQRNILYDSIGYYNVLGQPDFGMACLQAVEQIGDAAALPYLARLIVRDAPTQQERHLRERARQCLTHLTQTLDFGSKADIPRWITKLPCYSSSNSSTPVATPSGAEDALIALFALIQLLPQLQPSDKELLKASERERLAEAWPLMSYPLFGGNALNAQQARLGAAFSYAVLHALEQIGTGRDLQSTERLLREVPAEELPPLRIAEHSVKIVLERRREKEETGQTLLRGASAPPAASGELLRAAQPAIASTEPHELLHPATIPIQSHDDERV